MTQTAKLDITRRPARTGHRAERISGLLRRRRRGHRHGLSRERSRRTPWVSAVRVSGDRPGPGADAALGQGHAALGTGRGDRHAAGKTVRAALSAQHLDQPSTWEVFTLMSWRDKRLMAVCQAGLVEKFVDALVWVFYPVFLYRHGVSIATSAGLWASTASYGAARSSLPASSPTSSGGTA